MKISKVIPLAVGLVLLIVSLFLIKGIDMYKAGEGSGMAKPIKTVEGFLDATDLSVTGEEGEIISGTYRIKSHYDYSFGVIQRGSSSTGTLSNDRNEDIESVIYFDGKSALIQISATTQGKKNELVSTDMGGSSYNSYTYETLTGDLTRVNATVYTELENTDTAYIKIDEYSNATSSYHSYLKPEYLGKWIKVPYSKAMSVFGLLDDSMSYFNGMRSMLNSLINAGEITLQSTSVSLDTFDYKRIAQNQGTSFDNYTNFDFGFTLDTETGKGAVATIFRDVKYKNINNNASYDSDDRITETEYREDAVVSVENYGNTVVDFKADRVEIVIDSAEAFDAMFIETEGVTVNG